MKLIHIIIVMTCMTLLSIVSSAQSYVRYMTNDDSYHGFYTDEVDSIRHVIYDGEPVQEVYQNGKCQRISLSCIEDLLFEGITLNKDNVGEYRMYELDIPDEDFNKIYVDNRAVLMASRNGDFGANDTIVISSAYNDIKALVYTDSLERVRSYFDGKNYFIMDYNEDNSVDIINFNGEDFTIPAGRMAMFAGPIKVANKFKWLKEFNKLRENAAFKEYTEFGIERVIDAANNIALNLDSIENDPELRDLHLLYNRLSIVGDIVGIAASIYTIVPSRGLTAPILAYEVYDLSNDLNELLNNMYPLSEQKKRYKDFYAQKYGIHIETLPVNTDDVKATSATLKGLASIPKDRPGVLSFEVTKLRSEEYRKVIPANYSGFKVDEVVADVSSLKPHTDYYYELQYEIVVDGISLKYQGEIEMFYTPGFDSGYLDIDGITNVTSTTATINIIYNNMTPDVKCGLCYYSSTAELYEEGWEWEFFSLNGSGTKSINVSRLYPDADYGCIVFIGENLAPGNYSYSSNIHVFHTDRYNFPSLSGVKVEDHWYQYYPHVHRDVYITDISDWCKENGGEWGFDMISVEGLLYRNFYTLTYDLSCGCTIGVDFYVDRYGFDGFKANSIEDSWWQP